jgi:hypothetical protein
MLLSEPTALAIPAPVHYSSKGMAVVVVQEELEILSRIPVPADEECMASRSWLSRSKQFTSCMSGRYKRYVNLPSTHDHDKHWRAKDVVTADTEAQSKSVGKSERRGSWRGIWKLSTHHHCRFSDRTKGYRRSWVWSYYLQDRTAALAAKKPHSQRRQRCGWCIVPLLAILVAALVVGSKIWELSTKGTVEAGFVQSYDN